MWATLLSEREPLPFPFRGLAQVAAQFLVAALALGIGGTDAAAEDVGLQALRALGCQRIVEQVRPLGCVAVQITEGEFEVVVEAVAGHAAVAAVGGLVHLEGRGHVLAVANHGHGDVADEHRADDGVRLLRVQADEFGPNAVGHAPAVDHREDLQAVQLLHALRVGIHLRPGLPVTVLINNDGEAVAGLNTCGHAHAGQNRQQ